MLQDWPGIRLENQLIFQLQTEILIGPMKHRQGLADGAGIKPTLAIRLSEEKFHDSQASLNGTPVGSVLLRGHPSPVEDQWIHQSLTLRPTSLDPAFQN